MAATAERLNAATGQWELVYAVNMTEEDRQCTYRCSCCKAPACLAICSEKENYFFSLAHALNCDEAKGHKIIHVNTSTKINITAILEYEDCDIRGGDEGPAPDGPDDDDDQGVQEGEERDLRLDPNGTRTIRSARGMFTELMEKQGNANIDDYTAREVNSIFLRRDTLRSFKENWGCPEKLVVAKRCFPNKLKQKIPVPGGYVLLRDAYSGDDEDAIYFIVKMGHPEHNENFKERLFGKEPEAGEERPAGEKPQRVGRDPHKHIVIFARWSRVKHSHYRVYKAELNSRMITFLNAPDV